MKELFLQGIGKIDCEKILGALWGLDTDLRKLQERLEKIFSFDIQIEYDRNSRKEHKGHISGKVTEKISLEQVSDYLSSWKEVSDFGKKRRKWRRCSGLQKVFLSRNHFAAGGQRNISGIISCPGCNHGTAGIFNLQSQSFERGDGYRKRRNDPVRNNTVYFKREQAFHGFSSRGGRKSHSGKRCFSVGFRRNG